jgi:hypothetical protein
MKSRNVSMCFGKLLLLVLLLGVGIAGKAQSFTVAANPQSVTVYPGETNVAVSVSAASSTYTGPIIVTLSGLPSGITIASAPLTLTAGGTGTILLNVGLNADQEAFPAAEPSDPNSALNTVTVVGAVGAVTSTSTLNLTVSLSNPSFAPGTGQINLPIVTINTSGTPIVDKTTNVPGTVTITSANGSTSYLPNSSDSDDTGTFHLHGNSTLDMPKKAYDIKLNTSLDLLSQMGLTCPYVTSSGKEVCDKAKHFILLANYDDKTLLRDWSASALANAIPYGGSYLNETPVPSGNTGVIPTPSGNATLMPWAAHSLFVELYLNGVYEGNYQLIEDVRVDTHRVNITELTESQVSGDLTGGYLFEIDQHEDEAFVFNTPQGIPIGLIDPDFTPDPEVPEQTSYISNYVDAAETALFSTNFTDPTLGWRAYFDEASAVNFYLVNDIMGNVDGGDFYSSDYLYKAVDNPLIYMGPIWDFDISSGNVNYEAVENPTVPWMRTQAAWYARWFDDPGFKADVVTQFNALKNNGVLSSWVASIPTEAATLQQSQANNFNRWPMLGIKVWPNPEAAGSYTGEVAYLTNYLNLRISYLDSVLNGKVQTSTSLSAPSGTLYLGASETLVAHVSGGQSPTGTVSFLAGNAVIGTATLDSSETATLVTTSLPLGNDAIEAVYNGDSSNALSSSTATTANVVHAPGSSVTTLSTSAASAGPGIPVTLSVSVVGNSGNTVPTGTVSFTSNGATIGSVALTAAGTASFSTSSLASGNDSIQAIYSGDSLNQASSSNIDTVTVNASGVQVTFGASLAGLTYAVDGVSYSSQVTLSLGAGTTHTITTSSPQINSGTQSTFTGWSDGGGQTHSITIPSSPITYTANFSSAYLLTTSVVPAGYGTVSVSPSGTNGYYAPGTVVNLTANAVAGISFTSWTGNVANANSPTTSVTMISPQTISANFSSSGSGVSFGSGFTAGAVSLNGTAILNGTSLQLTDGGTYEAASSFSKYAVNVQSFTNDFTFQLTNASADGFMFVLQNQGAGALGSDGQDLGFGYGISQSVGIKFDLYDNAGEGPDSTGLYTDGTRPTTPATDLTPSGVNLHSGDVFHAHMTYDGTTLTVTIADTVTGATATQSYTVNIPSIVGGNTAFAGFTAGTGGVSATQDILTWTYVPGASAPTVASPTFLPVGGTYATAQPVMLSDATTGASIYYTLDGSPATTSSTLYSGQFTVSATTTVNAIAALNGVTSPMSSAMYTINAGSSGSGGGFTTGEMALNGSAALNGTQLQLTNGGSQAGSAFAIAPVNVQSFTNDFTFQLPAPTSDGIMFVLQNQGATALGSNGQDLGFGYGIAQSVGIKFDLYNNNGEGPDSTGLFTDGTRPTTPAIDLTASGVNLHSGDVFHVHMNYDGTTLTVTITDTVTGATATQSYTVNIPSIVGGNTAYVGFTGGTGSLSSTENILTWTYVPGASSPTVASPTFSPIGGTYAAAEPVMLSDTTSGASIYYTLDGSPATTSSTLYSGQFTVSATTTVNAIAALNGVTSPMTTATYTINAGSSGSGGGFTTGEMALNGSAALNGAKLQLTNGSSQAGSAFALTPVNVQSFTNDFTFQLPAPTSDGIMFVLQNQGATALGSNGQDLGFGYGIAQSVGIKFDLYNNNGEGPDSTGLFTDGTRPTTPATDLTPSGVNLHSGDVFHVHMTYDGTTLTVTITDTVTGATATQTYTVNIPSIVGGNSAYAGFTAGTGGTATAQNVLTWTYTSGASSPTTASPTFSPIGGTYATAQPVMLSDTTSGASIYYTLDSSPATTSSTLYSGQFTVSATTTVNAIAALNGVMSPMSTATYTISAGGSGGFTTGEMRLNGSAALNGAKLQLTNGSSQAGSAFVLTPVNVQSFTNDFTFQLPAPTSDGIMFVLQNQGATALGSNGQDLGFGYGIAQSVGIKFDLYNNNGEGPDSTGLFTDGTRPTMPATDLTPSGVNLHSGDVFHVHMTYDGTTLTVTIADTVTGATATQTYTVNIPSIVGGNSAYVGFTAGTGGTATAQNVLTWTYSPGVV